MLILPGRSASWNAGSSGLSEVTCGGSAYFSGSQAAQDADSAAASAYLKFKTSNAFLMTIHEISGGRSVIDITSGGAINVRCRSTTNSEILNITSSTGYADGSEHEMFWSYDASAGTSQLYIDGTSDKATTTTETTGTIDHTRSNWHVLNANGSGGDAYTGGLWRFCYWQDVSLDCSSAGVRANMADETKSGTLGDNIIEIYDVAAMNAGTNQGSGSNFSVSGTFT